MLQREIVRFRASDTQPNPLEVDYWIDVTSNYYGGCIRYYRNDTNTWEMLDLNEQFINEAITEIRNELAEFKDELKEEVNKLWQYINQKVEELTTQINNIRNEINDNKGDVNNIKNELKTYVDGKVTDLTELINQEIENRTNADNNIQSQINELKQLITNAQNAIDTHAARRDNPHVVTRAQLSLATTDSVVFNKVSAPSGFFKE